jgi:aldose 1-epimerase
MASAAHYSALQTSIDGVAVVRLADEEHKTAVSIATGVGNLAYEMKVNGKNVLYFPFASLGELKEKPALCGVPFLAPWANRLDQMAFFANGRKYALNADLGNIRKDGHGLPIHGLLSFSPLWEVMEAKAADTEAHVTSRLEFWKYPELMAQFPFAHTIEMTYTLSGGVLQVETALKNLSHEAMPVSVGFHPYFTLHDAPRDAWSAHVAAREHVVLSKLLVPTGEMKPMDLSDPVHLAGTQLDDVFMDLVRGADGRAEFWVQGKNEKISVSYGPKYPVAVAYAPPRQNFICFEPMAGLTNAMNMAQEGLYKGLQSVAPGGEWRESFWIRPSGF